MSTSVVQKVFSYKVRVLSFIAAIMVVLIHGSAASAGGVSAWNACVHNFATQQLTCVAVPFFFVMSGFWFARGAYMQGNGGGYRKLMVKKLKTLLAPYLIWAIVGLPFVLGYYGLWNYLHHSPIFERTCLESGSFLPSINRIFAIWNYDMPGGDGPLWYVRALLIIFACAPLWKWIYHKCHWVLLLVFLAIIVFAPSGKVPGVALQYGRASYFLLGMFLAHYAFENWRMPKMLEIILCAIALPYLVCQAYCVTYGVEVLPWFDRLKPFVMPILLMTFWFGYDLFSRESLDNVRLPEWLNCSFLIYCMHGPLIVVTMVLPRFLLGTNDFIIIALTLMSTSLIVLFGIGFARVLRHRPIWLALLAGGRA